MPSNPTIQYEKISLEAARLRKSADSLSQALKATEDKLADLYAESITLPRPLPIVDTEWAKNFKATNPNQYLEALEYVMHPEFSVIVTLLPTSQIAVQAVIDGVNSEFCLAVFDMAEDATKLCKEMGWKQPLFGT